MFGVIVASRPVLTDIQTISPTQFAFNIPSQPSFSHIVVFLLPGNSLQPGAAAAVYVQLPPSTEFKLLGAIANDKQSAIFRVNSQASDSDANLQTSGDDLMVDDATSQPVGDTAQPGGPNLVVGISVEPAENIQAQLATLKSLVPASQRQSSTGAQVSLQQSRTQLPPNTKVLAQRVIKNAFNFLSSFASGSSGHEVVPLKSFQDWWTKFEKRLDLDHTFLEREDQD